MLNGWGATGLSGSRVGCRQRCILQGGTSEVMRHILRRVPSGLGRCVTWYTAVVVSSSTSPTKGTETLPFRIRPIPVSCSSSHLVTTRWIELRRIRWAVCVLWLRRTYVMVRCQLDARAQVYTMREGNLNDWYGWFADDDFGNVVGEIVQSSSSSTSREWFKPRSQMPLRPCDMVRPSKDAAYLIGKGVQGGSAGRHSCAMIGVSARTSQLGRSRT
jgi:hypothetical protein